MQWGNHRTFSDHRVIADLLFMEITLKTKAMEEPKQVSEMVFRFEQRVHKVFARC